MNICYVAPIDVTKKLGELTYFSTLDIDRGDMVEIYINKRKLHAIVLHTESAENIKHELRTNDFQIKKITKIIKKNAISKDLFESLELSASICGTIISQIVDALIPKHLIGELENIKKSKNEDDVLEYLITNNDHNILVEVKKIIREEFAKKNSIAIIAPTILAAEKIYEDISHGIENKCAIYHSDLSPKAKEKNEELINTSKNICIVSTPSLIGFLKNNTDAFIIYDESSRYYRSFEGEIDMKRAIITTVKNLKKKIIYATNAMSVELYIKHKDKKLINIQKDLIRDNIEKIKIVKLDTKREKANCIYWDMETEAKMKRYVNDGEMVVLFTERRGLYTSCVCRDCGMIKKCNTCDKPYVLHKKSEERLFICHTCKKKEIVSLEQEIICEYCGGWRMESLGVGTTGIKSYVEENIATDKIFVIDSDNTKTKKEALRVYKRFEQEGGILIGTEMILPMIKNINLMIVVSIDSLFSIPEYNLDEEIFKTFIRLNSSLGLNSEMIINTRTDEKIFEYIQNINIEKFLHYELNNRESTGLPPYSYLITFDIEKNINKIPRFLEIFANYSVAGNTFRRNIIMIPADKWEEDVDLRDKTISNLLSYNLKINPRNIFKGIL